MFSPDYSKRDYLLRPGCKDLIDAINLQAGQSQIPLATQAGKPVYQVSPPKGDILVSADTTVRDLAAMLGKKPYEIIADAMELGVFSNVKTPLAFEIISKIASKYGFTARAKR